MSNITHDYIVDFIRELQPTDQEFIHQLEVEAEETGVPIIPIEVKSFMKTILAAKRPKKILEIGTAIGYSSLVMSEYLDEGGQIVTIERNPKMLVRAKKNISHAGKEDCIKILEGTAEEILPEINEKFDFIFIDAAKGQYHLFYNYAKELLNDEGIIFADNVLHKGMVAKDRYDIPRRQRTIHRRMREYLEELLNDENYQASLLPLGDGVTVCYKKKEKSS